MVASAECAAGSVHLFMCCSYTLYTYTVRTGPQRRVPISEMFGFIPFAVNACAHGSGLDIFHTEANQKHLSKSLSWE